MSITKEATALPRLLAKTMCKRLHRGYNDQEEKAPTEGEYMDVAKDSELEIQKMCKDTGVFRKRLSSIISKSKTGNVRNRGEGKEQGRCSVEGSNGSDQPFVLNGPASGHKYCRKHHKHDWKRNHQGSENTSTIKRLDNQLQGRHHSFFGFFDKKERWNFIKENINRVNENSHLSIRRHIEVDNATAIRVTSSFRFVGRDQIKSGMVMRRRQLKIARLSYKKVNKQYLEEEDGGACSENLKSYSNNELCRKRILMGRRCKTLSSSGILMYDKSGCLIPDLK